MVVSARGRTLAFHLALALALGLALAAAPSREARAQQQEEKALPARVVAEKIDEYGPIRHCDLTARLDNLAVELMNDPGALGYLVGYDPARREGRYAESYVERSSTYLVMSRGIDDSRIRMRYGGRNDSDEVKTELWVVPQGAHFPLDTKPLGEADDGREFSGRLESYSTRDGLHGAVDEMSGPSPDEISQFNFARLLKRQPASQGYLVVYTAADELPGAWRRIARREGQAMRGRFAVPEGRVRVVNGGTAAESGVELWLQPKDAPPPVKEAREERSLSTAFKLYDLDQPQEVAGEDEEGRLLADLADLVVADERARLSLIIHPATPDPEAETEAETGAEAPQTAEAATPAAVPSKVAAAEGAEVAAQTSAEQPATTAADENGPVPDAVPEDFQQKARRWRERLAKNYGIAPERVSVTVGRKNSWDNETLEVWVVPADAPLPDAFAPEPPDEPEDEPEVEPEDEPEPTQETEEGEAPPAV